MRWVRIKPGDTTTATIDIRELPGRIDELISLAAAGQEVILTDGAAPCAKLVPLPTSGRVAGLHAGAIQPATDFDAPLPDDFWAGKPCHYGLAALSKLKPPPAMRISFDLDDTLICYQPGVPCEPGLPWRWRWLGGSEPLRRGAIGFMRRLRQAGWEVWVYTTSYRRPASVRWWLWCHGVRVGKVINQDVHDRALRRRCADFPPSKNPGAFGIDLHVDDSVGVRTEGERHGFRVVVVAPDDASWTEAVLAAVSDVEGRRFRRT